MSQPHPILVFAAGKGTRMRHLTQDRPKPLVKIAGRSLLRHTLAYATPELAAPVVINIHTKGEMIRDALTGDDVIFSDESDRLRETGGGLKYARPHVGDSPCFTMNSDAVFAGSNPLGVLAKSWRPDMGALLLLVDSDAAVGHSGTGDFDLGDNGSLTRGTQTIYTGAQIIDPTITDRITEDVFSMNVAWNILAAEGRLFGARYSGRWCDVGQPESVPLAERLVAEASHV